MFSPKEYLYNLVTYKVKGPLAAFLRGILFLSSLAYGLIVTVISFFYRLRPVRFNCRIISVGNITLGGTGKTSLVGYLAAKLSQQGNKVAVLSRGYKRDKKLSGLDGIGDEPAMLQKKLPQVPVIVERDRLKASIRAIQDYAADTLILDDGMQQWRIHKDLEITTIDAGNPFGNLRLLPAGFLREPLAALSRSDIFVLTQADAHQDTAGLKQKLKRFNPCALIVESRHKPVGFSNLSNPGEALGVDIFKGKTVVAFSGIGNQQAFENTLCSLGVTIARSLRFADHQDYTQADLDGVIRYARERSLGIIITTEKDAVKVARLEIHGVRIFSLNIKLSITSNEAEFDRRLFKLRSL